MARKTIRISDFSAREIGDDKQSATITVRFGDGRRGVVVADAHVDDPIVGQVTAALPSRCALSSAANRCASSIERWQ